MPSATAARIRQMGPLCVDLARRATLDFVPARSLALFRAQFRPPQDSKLVCTPICLYTRLVTRTKESYFTASVVGGKPLRGVKANGRRSGRKKPLQTQPVSIMYMKDLSTSRELRTRKAVNYR